MQTNFRYRVQLKPTEQVELRSEVSGVVQAISFREGSLVSKGQVLVKVNDIELKAQLIQAKTRENLAKENERRAQLLLQKEAISQEEYDMALADYKSAPGANSTNTSSNFKNSNSSSVFRKNWITLYLGWSLHNSSNSYCKISE